MMLARSLQVTLLLIQMLQAMLPTSITIMYFGQPLKILDISSIRDQILGRSWLRKILIASNLVSVRLACHIINLEYLGNFIKITLCIQVIDISYLFTKPGPAFGFIL